MVSPAFRRNLSRASVPFIFCCLLLTIGCDSKKDNFMTRAYHDVTSRDNAYFNANLRIQDTERRLWEDQVEIYDEVLPVFKYGGDGAGKSAAGDMDEVIKKCSFPINLHESSKWVDDAYFLTGKAYFIKQDYEKALEFLQFTVAEYQDIEERRKKKKKKKKKKGKKKKDDEEVPSMDEPFAFLKHHERHPEASLWVIRTLIEMERYTDAQTGISVLRGDEMFPKALQAELESIEAHLLVKQKRYDAAIAPVMKASELTKNRELRARYTFILAQLYARQGQSKKAIETYEEVLKLNPDYEMEFFAQINMANILRSNKLKSGDEIKKILTDLLKDEKNIDYFGLIYYAIADIELEAGRKESGIKNLNLSVRNAGSDAQQKALSYLRIADINYEETEFQPAYYYYDSTLMTLAKNYERYKEIEARRDGLEGLVEHLKTIENEERLQHWAGLPEKPRNAEIEEWLEENFGPQNEEDIEDFDPLASNPRSATVGAGGTGKWYFYDPASRSRGFSEFKKNWGKRSLEDHWRRTDKRTFELEDETEQEGDAASADGTVDLDSDELTLEDIVAGLPDDSAKLAASDAKIAEALYQTGNIYKEYLDSDPQARSYYKQLLDRYPDTEYRLKAVYNLYLLTQAPEKESYKQIILTEFPESIFAEVIRDPDYFVKLEQKDKVVKEYYATTYDYFEAEAYDTVLSRVAQAFRQFEEDNPIKPHFALLEAMAIGEKDSANIDNFKIKLQGVVNDYPNTEQATRAQEILNHLRRGSVIKRAEEDAAKGTAATYEFTPDAEHFVCVVVFKTGRDVATIKNQVSDFNRRQFETENYRTSSLLFGSDQTIILVKTFENQDRAMRYYRDIKTEDAVYNGLSEDEYKVIVVSRTNYTQLYRNKDMEGYFDYFEDFYLDDDAD